MNANPDDVTPDGVTPTEVRRAPASVPVPVFASAGCSVCRDFDWAETDAERTGDLSAATDWRVLRRRHQAAEHEEAAAGSPSATPVPHQPAEDRRTEGDAPVRLAPRGSAP
ncbi:hypothetical protein [Streptomyces sp. NPDC002690]